MKEVLPFYRSHPVRDTLHAELLNFFDGAAQILPSSQGWTISLLGTAERTFKINAQATPEGFVHGVEIEYETVDRFTGAVITGLKTVLAQRWS